MWLFIPTHGYFSVVSARTGNGAHTNPTDPDRLNLRARDRRHLELLIADFEEFADAEIIDTPNADYACRIICDKQAWAAVLNRLVMNLDYENFKNHAHENEGRTGAAFNDILPEVWSITRRMQSNK